MMRFLQSHTSVELTLRLASSLPKIGFNQFQNLNFLFNCLGSTIQKVLITDQGKYFVDEVFKNFG